MLVSFDKSDFCSKVRWFSFLAKIKVPDPVQENIETVTIETTRISAMEKIGEQLNTVRYNPDTAVHFC